MSTRPTILMVDDDPRSHDALAEVLEDEFDVHHAASTSAAERVLRTEWVQIVLCRERMPGISGVRYLRQMLVVGAMAVIRYAERHGTTRPWLVQLMARRTAKVAAVALANKNVPPGQENPLGPCTFECELTIGT